LAAASSAAIAYLSDEGRLLVEGARRLLAEADELESLIRLGVNKISGPIRLSAPILDAFLAEHPEVTIHLNLTDGYVDLVGQDRILPSGMANWRTVRCGSSASATTGALYAPPRRI
jgi:hypothetical protein